MVDWNRFAPEHFEYDFDRDKLAIHGLSFEEAVESFFAPFAVRRNKRYRDRYQLVGSTAAGKRVKIIFQLQAGSVVRIITGWFL